MIIQQAKGDLFVYYEKAMEVLRQHDLSVIRSEFDTLQSFFEENQRIFEQRMVTLKKAIVSHHYAYVLNRDDQMAINEESLAPALDVLQQRDSDTVIYPNLHKEIIRIVKEAKREIDDRSNAQEDSEQRLRQKAKALAEMRKNMRRLQGTVAHLELALDLQYNWAAYGFPEAPAGIPEEQQAKHFTKVKEYVTKEG